MKKTKRLVHEVAEGKLFFSPDLLDGERRMTFYIRGNDGDVEDPTRYARIRRLGLMQFRIEGSKRVNIRVREEGADGLLARNLPVIELG